MRFAELNPELPASIFPQRLQNQVHSVSSKNPTEAIRVSNGWKGSEELFPANRYQNDDFGDDELDDQDFIAAGKCFPRLYNSPDFFQRMQRNFSVSKNSIQNRC